MELVDLGGGQELGETTRAAALRELKEETGVDAELIGLLDVIDTVRDEEGRIQFHYTLLILPQSGRLENQSRMTTCLMQSGRRCLRLKTEGFGRKLSV